MKTTRKYGFKDVELLIASLSLCNHFEKHKARFIAIRSGWADPFIANFKLRIDNAVDTYLGADVRKELRNATQALLALQSEALEKLGVFKTQVESDFEDEPARRDGILISLGFKAHYRAAAGKDQEALIELLSKFKTNMDAALQADLVQKGMAQALINDLITFAGLVKDADVVQEGEKANSPEVTAEGINEMNAIFRQSILICKIGARLFSKQPRIRSKFVFSKLISNLNKSKVTKTKTIPPPANSGPDAIIQ